MPNKSSQQLIGESPAFLETLEEVSRVSALDKPVLIIGERGTGKELIAERLHYLSPRWDRTLVKMNCASLPEDLLETELFGHEAGAFTGAARRHRGRFERADGGTLFLDEIASMSLRLQEKLLRVIEYGEYERVGGEDTLYVDVRIVGAANVDLPSLAARGEFRADLLDRLAFDVITLPPLRYRQEDIPILAEYFALGMVKTLKRAYFLGFSESAMQSVLGYGWPGNLRELKNAIERAVYRNDPEELITQLVFDPFESPYRPETRLTAQVLTETEVESQPGPAEIQPEQSYPYDFKKKIQDYEIDLLEQALQREHYSQTRTAKALQLSYHQLRGYLRKYDLREEESLT